jgi:hypothetical protein
MKRLIKNFKLLQNRYNNELIAMTILGIDQNKFRYLLMSYSNFRLQENRSIHNLTNMIDEEIFNSSLLKFEGKRNIVRRVYDQPMEEHPIWFYINIIDSYDSDLNKN